MPLSKRQHFFLAELDIPVWELRETSLSTDAEIDDKSTAYTPPAFDIDLSPAIWLLMASTEMNGSEARLFDAMLKARKLSRRAVAVIDFQTFAALAGRDTDNKTLLVMGETSLMPAALSLTQPTLIQQNESRWIATYSLQDMLQQPALKATVWQALKLLPVAN